MNNFTKQELEQIYRSLSFSNITELPVAIKIKSMIDSYCEHSSDGYIYTNAEFTNDNPFKCYKCGEYFNHE